MTSLKKNYIYNTLLTLMNVAYPLITFPYVSRIIGPEGVGKVNFANSVVVYFLWISALGIPGYGIREISRVKNDQEKLNRTFSELVSLNLMAILIATPVFVGLVFCIGQFKSEAFLFLIMGLQIALSLFGFDWFFNGIENYGYITFRVFLIRVMTLIMLFVMVRNPGDYVLYGVLLVISASGPGLINIFYAKKYVKFTFKGLHPFRHLRILSIALSTNFLNIFYLQMDKVLLGLMCSPVYVGFYSLSEKIFRTSLPFVVSLSTVTFPKLSHAWAQGQEEEFHKLLDKEMRFNLALAIPAAFGIFMVAPDLVMLFGGSEFAPAVDSLRLLGFIIVASAVQSITGLQLLYTVGKEKFHLISVFMGMVAGMALYFILIPLLNHTGAAIATLSAETVAMTFQLWFGRKYLKGKVFNAENLKVLVSACLMSGALYFLSRTGLVFWLSLGIELAGASLVYGLSLLALRSSLATEAIAGISRRLRKK